MAAYWPASPIRSRSWRASRTTSRPATWIVPAIGLEQRGQDPHDGRLAGAVGAQQPEDRPARHVEIDAAERAHVTEVLDQPADGDRRPGAPGGPGASALEAVDTPSEGTASSGRITAAPARRRRARPGRRRRPSTRAAIPIAKPITAAPMYGGATSSSSAMPSIASQIAGRNARQSPVILEQYVSGSAGAHLTHAGAELGADALLDRGRSPGTPPSDASASAR